MRRPTASVLALLLALVLQTAVAGPASAHTALLGSSPAPGERLAYSPEEVLLSFADPIDPATLTVSLRSADGAEVAMTSLTPSTAEVSAAAYGVPRLSHGVYGLTWESVGDDGHRARGEVLFGVGVTPAGEALAGAPAEPVAVALDLLAAAARIGWYLALAAAAAVAVLGRVDALPGSAVVSRRRQVRLGLAAAAVLRGVVGSVIVLHAGGGVGRALGTSTLTWVVLAAGLAVAARGAAGPRWDWGVLGAAVLVGTLAGHAPDRPDPVLAVTFGVAHLGAAAVWVGPLTAVALAARSSAWRQLDRSDRATQLQAALRAVVPAAGLALGIVLASGGLLALRAVDVGSQGWTTLLQGAFGWALLAKTAVVLGVVLPLGWAHHRRRQDWVELPGTWRVEAVGLLAALVLGSVLVGVDPGWGGDVGGADQALAGLLDGQADDPAACAELEVGRAACTRTALATMLLAEGPQAAIDQVAALSQTDDYVAGNCHQVAHDLGNDAAERISDMADALAVEGSVCWSGYYHGFVEARLAAVADDDLIADLPGFCDGAADPEYSFTHYNCVHGLGHGIMLRVDADLFQALPMCEALGEAWTIRSCASGVFMENVMAAQQGIEDVAFDDTDLLYPCTEVEGIITEDCYLMQTSYILWHLDGDVEGAFRWCDTAAEPHQATCYRSMGRDISGRSSLDVDRVVADCHLGRPDLRSWCFDGAASNAVYETAATDAADRLCAAVQGQDATRCAAARDQAAAVVAAG